MTVDDAEKTMTTSGHLSRAVSLVGLRRVCFGMESLVQATLWGLGDRFRRNERQKNGKEGFDVLMPWEGKVQKIGKDR